MRFSTVRRFFSGALTAAVLVLSASAVYAQDGWINEFHYDDDGTDLNESIEVAIPSSFAGALSDYTVVRYNQAGTPYGTDDLSSFTVGATSNGFTLYSIIYPTNGLQNGPNDGFALCYDDGGTNAPVTSGGVVQVLSYEGTFTAASGCANGLTSTDIGVSEPSTTPDGQSLQLQGTGSDYADFTWAGPIANTRGAVNTSQTFGNPTPSVSFVNTSQTVSEGSQTTFNIAVQINDPDGTEVTVDVVLAGGTATAPDFNNSTTQTVTFPTTASDGDIVNATFDLTDDTDSEGDETATFELQNVTGTGTIVSPSTTTVTIDDDDDILVINEIHADPDGEFGDANNDGIIQFSGDEFVEIVNTDFLSIDISGYTLSDAVGVRHTFPAGTILNSRQAVVVFGGGTPTGSFGGSVVQTASTGTLQLNNTGDTVTLRDASNNVVAQVTYGSTIANDDQSITRDPDLTGTFVKHTTAEAGVRYSPGTRFDGDPFSGGPPVVVFSTNRDSANEPDGTYEIIVQLLNPGGAAVSVDVAFDGSGSTADASDVGNFTTQTVTFDGSPSDVSEQVIVTLTDDAIAEFDEEAVFVLTNLTGDPNASIGNPDVLTLEILDDDAPTYPNLVINEILYDPPGGSPGDLDSGDANNDGDRDGTEDKFIEIVNTDATSIDISGFTVSDITQVRHTFPAGTVLQPNQAIVVFGGGDPQGPGFGGAIVQVATTGLLSFANDANNQGDEVVTLRDDQGFEAAEVIYNADTNGIADQSIVRNPELTGNFIGHLAAQADVEFSPGTEADGTAFGGGDPSAIITVAKGQRGWRMLAPPVSGFTVSDLVPQNLVQGLSDEYPTGDPNVYRYDGTGFVVPGTEAAALPAGEGFIWYFFDIAYDPADAGITDGESESFPLPYMIQASGPETSGDVTVTLDNGANGNGRIWELLGNPFDEAIDVDAITTNGTDGTVGVGCVWDPNAGANGSYVLTDAAIDEGGANLLAVWQGAFFENTDGATEATIPNTAQIGFGAEFYGRPVDEDRARIGFELLAPSEESGELEIVDRNLRLFFGADATDEWDRQDLSKLTPFGSVYATMAFVGEFDGVETLKASESRPFYGSTFEAPLAFEAAGISGAFTFAWPNWSNVPEGWVIELIDTQTGTTVDLREEESYTFTAEASRPADLERGLAAPKAETLERSSDARFTLRVTRATTASGDGLATPDVFEISAAYPNPFSSQSTIEYAVPYASEVSIRVYDVLGREVATLVEGTVEAGRRSATFSAAGLASGVYLVRMTADGFAQTKRVVVTH